MGTFNRKISRRNVLKYGLAGAGVVFGASVADGFFVEPEWLQVTRPEISVKDLAAEFDGFRIVLLTDIHHSRVVSLDYVSKAVEAANAQAPDLVVLGGDYVTHGAEFIPPVFEVLSGLKAKHGIVAVLGNHDHWTDAEMTKEQLAGMGAELLTNAGAVISVGGAELCVAGVGDLWEDVQSLEKALGGIDPGTPRVLLSHNPDYAEEMGGGHRVDLMLSGHTHGGQYVIPGLGAPIVPSKYGNKYRAGLVEGPHCRVYVSRGVGLVSPPVRFFCRPELPVITLRRA